MIWAHLAYPPSVDPLGLRLLSAGRPKGACPVHPEPQGQVPGQQIVPQVDQPPPVGHLRLPAQEEPPEVPHFPDRTQWRPGHRLARPAACWAATCLDRREIQRDHDLAHAYRQVALRQPLAQVGSPQQVLIQTVKPRAFVHASRHTDSDPSVRLHFVCLGDRHRGRTLRSFLDDRRGLVRWDRLAFLPLPDHDHGHLGHHVHRKANRDRIGTQLP